MARAASPIPPLALQQIGAPADLRRELTKAAFEVDAAFSKIWDCGANIILGWSSEQRALIVLAAPYWRLADLTSKHLDITRKSHHVALADIKRLSEIIELRPINVELSAAIDEGSGITAEIVDRLVRRYSLNFVPHRAVVLFDIVGFSKFTPMQQFAQLNSLAHSINSASLKLRKLGVQIDPRRSTTGDGFYVWNFHEGYDGDTAVFHLMSMILANNRLARESGAAAGVIPALRTCIAIDSHFEYYHAQDGSPQMEGYIVGDVTIKLARMAGKTLPDQILVGDFLRPNESTAEYLHPMEFIRRAGQQVDSLRQTEIADHRIVGIKSYLTGKRLNDTEFSVRRYKIKDKHGFLHHLFNAKVNIETDHGPIYLGLQTGDLNSFEATAVDIDPGYAFGVPVL
jgi:hypothetical protein